MSLVIPVANLSRYDRFGRIGGGARRDVLLPADHCP